MEKTKVLFVCLHNSDHSQMAEAHLNQFALDSFFAENIGLDSGKLNPIVVEAMLAVNIDNSKNEIRSVFDFFRQSRFYHFVIAICDMTNAERFQIFPGLTKRLSWSFEDPTSYTGTHEEKLAKTRLIRNSIKTEVEKFIKIQHQLSF